MKGEITTRRYDEDKDTKSMEDLRYGFRIQWNGQDRDIGFAAFRFQRSWPDFIVKDTRLAQAPQTLDEGLAHSVLLREKYTTVREPNTIYN